MSSNDGSHFSKPLASESADNHSAPLWVATILCLIITTIGVATRLFVRFKALGADDYVVFAGALVALAQFATIIAGLLRAGLGRSTDELSQKTTSLAGSLFLASEALFILTIYLVKHSVLCTVQRILGPDMKKARIVCWILQGLLVVCGIASLLVLLVKCSASALLTGRREDMCTSQTERWEALATLDGVTDIAIFAAFCALISTLQMKKTVKLTVSLLLAFRLVCVAFAGVHARYIAVYVTSSDPGIGVVGALVWQQLTMCYALLSALLIALKSFLQSFDVAMGVDRTYAHSSKGREGVSYGLKRLSEKGSKTGRTWERMSQKDTVDRDPNSWPEKSEYSANIFHPSEGRDGSIRSGISQYPMIRRDVQYTVTHHIEKDHRTATSAS